jgi:hypothetical protein
MRRLTIAGGVQSICGRPEQQMRKQNQALLSLTHLAVRPSRSSITSASSDCIREVSVDPWDFNTAISSMAVQIGAGPASMWRLGGTLLQPDEKGIVEDLSDISPNWI